MIRHHLRIRLYLSALCALLVAFTSFTTPALANGKANVCVDVKDKDQVQKGTATCSSDGTSRAIAVGSGSSATASDSSVARVIGDGSTASA